MNTQALELLKKVAFQVQPIMRKRQLRVPLLAEFFPRGGNLVSIPFAASQHLPTTKVTLNCSLHCEI